MNQDMWCGKPIDDMIAEELREALRIVARQNASLREESLKRQMDNFASSLDERLLKFR